MEHEERPRSTTTMHTPASVVKDDGGFFETAARGVRELSKLIERQREAQRNGEKGRLYAPQNVSQKC